MTGDLTRIEITAQRPDDAPAIAELHREAFGTQGEKVAALVLDLLAATAPEERLSLVALLDGRVVGHVLFTRGFLDAPARLVDVRVLSPVGVAPEHQRCGVGAEMVRRGLELSGSEGSPAVFLEGDPRYYSRLGFVEAGPLGFRKPSLRIPDPGFQVVMLPMYEDWMTGTLVYHEAFWRHDCVGLREGL